MQIIFLFFFCFFHRALWSPFERAKSERQNNIDRHVDTHWSKYLNKSTKMKKKTFFQNIVTRIEVIMNTTIKVIYVQPYILFFLIITILYFLSF